MSDLLNPPRKIIVHINTDEELWVIVRGMRLLTPSLLQVAGTIDREDSQIIRRSNLPFINLSGVILYVVDYHEYDNVADSMCIDCQITFSENNPHAR